MCFAWVGMTTEKPLWLRGWWTDNKEVLLAGMIQTCRKLSGNFARGLRVYSPPTQHSCFGPVRVQNCANHLQRPGAAAHDSQTHDAVLQRPKHAAKLSTLKKPTCAVDMDWSVSDILYRPVEFIFIHTNKCYRGMYAWIVAKNAHMTSCTNSPIRSIVTRNVFLFFFVFWTRCLE